MFTCPNCKKALMALRSENGVCWVCDSCGGRAVAMALLRRTVEGQVVHDAWACAIRSPMHSGRACPVCAKEMLLVDVMAGGQSLALDVCQRCEFIWFDTNEFEALPPKPAPEPGSKPLSQEAKIQLALWDVERKAEQRRLQNPLEDQEWKAIPALFGMPVELDPAAMAVRPWATWILSVLIFAVSGAAFFDRRVVVDAYGLVPSEAGRLDGLTFITSFFLHTGPVHLVGNLYFLFVFGRVVENCIGPWRWLLLVAAAALFGDSLHVLFDPNATLPCVGASGGISGVLIFYAMKFPHARLGIMSRWTMFRVIPIPAWFAFVIWILLQSFGVYAQIHGYGHVSALAHFGGVIVGLGAYFLWRNLGAKPVGQEALFKVIG